MRLTRTQRIDGAFAGDNHRVKQAIPVGVEMFQKALIAAAATLALISVNANAVDEDAAKALAKQNKCTKCHSVDKKKDGPSFKETAAKYKGKPDGADKLYTHLTTSPEIEVDGKKEEHTAVKGSDADIKNLIAWILSQ